MHLPQFQHTDIMKMIWKLRVKRTNLLCVGLALTLMPCWAGVNEIEHLFQTALASGGAVPSRMDFFSAVNENTVRPLSVQEINNAFIVVPGIQTKQ